MFGLFNRKPAQNPVSVIPDLTGAQALRQRRANDRAAADRALVRATVDEMRIAQGMTPIDWEALS